MTTLTLEQAKKLRDEIAAITGNVTARVEGSPSGDAIHVVARMTRAGSGAIWHSRFEDSIPSAAEIVARLRAELGISARATYAAIAAERSQS